MKNAKIFTLLMTLTLLSACTTVSMTGRKQLNFVSSKNIDKSAIAHYHNYVNSNPKCQDMEKVLMINQVTHQLIQATKRYYSAIGESKKLNRYKWEITLIENSEPNAFVVGPGKIVIHTGILPIVENESGLAAVIGHEIAHALAEHGEERTSQVFLAQFGGLGLDILFQQKSAEFRHSVQLAYGIGVQLGAILPFSRKHEKEADEIGLYLMAMAGYDVYEAPQVWARMRATFGNSKTPFLETHPSHLDREQTLRMLIPKAHQYAQQFGSRTNQ